MNKKIAFFTPYFESNRGNATTTKRIVRGLNNAGIDTLVIPYLELRWTKELEYEIEKCDLYHILHFYRFAKWNMQNNLQLTKPYILTSGGTDINHSLTNQSQVEEMEKIILNASAITVFTKDGQDKVSALYPKKNIHIIPQSVWFEEHEGPYAFKFNKKDLIILLPAGIRAIKDPLFVWEAIRELKSRFKDLQFIIAGVVIEKNLHQKILKICQEYKWVHFMEDVPFHQMKGLYDIADLTINTSISEGQSSSILEAMYNYCPVLVRENKGNVSIVTHEKTGLVFSDEQEFFNMAIKLLTDQVFTQKIVKDAKSYITQYHSVEKEIKQYIGLYKTYS